MSEKSEAKPTSYTEVLLGRPYGTPTPKPISPSTYVTVRNVLQAGGLKVKGISGVGDDRHIIMADGMIIRLSREG